jgi:hypothetical protein
MSLFSVPSLRNAVAKAAIGDVFDFLANGGDGKIDILSGKKEQSLMRLNSGGFVAPAPGPLQVLSADRSTGRVVFGYHAEIWKPVGGSFVADVSAEVSLFAVGASTLIRFKLGAGGVFNPIGNKMMMVVLAALKSKFGIRNATKAEQIAVDEAQQAASQQQAR